jgi:hypothetical protein
MASVKAGFEAWVRRLRLQQAIYALVIKSANDVAATVGENLGGSESAFAAAHDPHGPRHRHEPHHLRERIRPAQPRQITTARDRPPLASPDARFPAVLSLFPRQQIVLQWPHHPYPQPPAWPASPAPMASRPVTSTPPATTLSPPAAVATSASSASCSVARPAPARDAYMMPPCSPRLFRKAAEWSNRGRLCRFGKAGAVDPIQGAEEGPGRTRNRRSRIRNLCNGQRGPRRRGR